MKNLFMKTENCFVERPGWPRWGQPNCSDVFWDRVIFHHGAVNWLFEIDFWHSGDYWRCFSIQIKNIIFWVNFVTRTYKVLCSVNPQLLFWLLFQFIEITFIPNNSFAVHVSTLIFQNFRIKFWLVWANLRQLPLRQ